MEGYNCSQSVFAAYADLYGLDKEIALRVSASFGGGIGRMRETCGAACGMFLVAGLATGAIDGKDIMGKKHNYDVVQQLAAEFKKENGSMICKELLGLTKSNNPSIEVSNEHTDTMPEARTAEYYKKRPCPKIIEGAGEIIERLLLDK